MKLVTPFDLSADSQLINVAGTSPSTTDMRGTAVIGAERELGALEYDDTLNAEGVVEKLITPFDLSADSQLIDVAGTSPTTTDMRGTSAIGGVRELGALEYDTSLEYYTSYIASLDAGSFALTGTDATWRYFNMPAGAGSFALTGTDVAWRYFTLPAGAGSFALTGTDASLRESDIIMSANAGSFAMTGTDASWRYFRLDANAGSFAMTGTNAGLFQGYGFLAGSGSFAVTGTPLVFRYSKYITELGTVFCVLSPSEDIRLDLSPTATIQSDLSPTADIIYEG